ncbi:hypothetical protein NPX13_g6584 [Xylaria arbuscula]|uniref:Uncharacterized protein n=1 Tax=Xylaria arbuscula TaxID=114810 RepID=A0A9W8NCK8_9PEZI|nr:hypothetical protein NPX13_g6584 [Xylaria arbuscula]
MDHRYLPSDSSASRPYRWLVTGLTRALASNPVTESDLVAAGSSSEQRLRWDFLDDFRHEDLSERRSRRSQPTTEASGSDPDVVERPHSSMITGRPPPDEIIEMSGLASEKLGFVEKAKEFVAEEARDANGQLSEGVIEARAHGM